jgi:2C-methyl-D-erythritol 2,4-cyclodiphosphate synthase
MPTITIRLDEDLLSKINHSKGDKAVSAYCKTIISEYFNTDVHNVYNSHEVELLKMEMQHKTDMLNANTERIQDLQNQIGFLQLEFQKINRINEQLLLSAPEEKKEKKWFEFWKV